MSRKTNKTNHVLNLLTSGVKAASETETPAGQPPSVSIVRKNDDGVADQIRDTLEKEFQTAVKEEMDEKEAKKEQEAQKQKAPVSEKKEEPPKKAQEPSSEKAEEEEDDFFIVNVMERLVKEKVPQYISQFHVCGCRRCLADVTALALTELPAKYVVINRSAVSPLMNFYSTKYAGRITVEVTKACMAVQKNPHHK
ncbi:MAG TPA: late competence development ComFB family protein [Candidatus Mediterraneibacter norfolkensis]|nr:late competence development ComFB family protein [Candidatus Mediterraneibacter norfolkensis]